MPARTRSRSSAAMARHLSVKQQKSIAYARNHKLALWTGAVSSGKTIASLIAFMGAVAEAETTGLIVIIGRTLQTIERNIIDPLQSPELFGPLAAAVQHTTGSPIARIFGRTVHLVGASDSRAEGRIRGSTIALAYVDEATLIPEAFWMMLLSRLRTKRPRLLATTNPDGPSHWLRKNFIKRAREVNMRVFEFRIYDNPSLTAQYIADLAAQYTGLWKRRFIDGEWCIAEGTVYEMWDPQVHMIRGKLPPIIALPGVGIDHGSVNPFAALMLGVAPADPAAGKKARLVLMREYRHDPKASYRQKTDVEFSRELREWIGPDRPEWIAVDPSATGFKLQLYHDGVDNVVNAKNDVLSGIRTVGSLLANGQLEVHESCEGLIDELPAYSWDPKAAARGEDKPLKEYDHSADAARYAIATTEVLWRPMLAAA